MRNYQIFPQIMLWNRPMSGIICSGNIYFCYSQMIFLNNAVGKNEEINGSDKHPGS